VATLPGGRLSGNIYDSEIVLLGLHGHLSGIL
jgi:hypothetical protein